MNMRTIGVMTAGILMLSAFAGTASAQCPPTLPPSSVMIEFDANSFAYETNGGVLSNPVGYISPAGNVLTMVGIIDRFYAPLAYLNPADPTKEYTFVVTGLVSGGTTTTINGPTTIYDTQYTGGTFAIYEGSPENAPLAGQMAANPPLGPTVPANFQDGTAILTGDLCGFNTSITKTGTIVNGSFGSTYKFTNPNAPGPPPAGNLFNAVGDGQAIFTGVWCVTAGGCTPTGYSAHPNGKWDSPPTTATLRSTWGTLKQLYR
jgi:hypothetical protein